MSTFIKNLPKPNDKHPDNNDDVRNIIDAIFNQEQEQVQPKLNKIKNNNIIMKLCHFFPHIILISLLFLILSNEYVDEIIMSFIPYFEKSPNIIFILFKLIIFITIFSIYILINE